MKEILVVRNGSSLLPLDAENEQLVREFPQGKLLKAKVTQPRSVAHNGFFHAFLQDVFPLWPRDHKAKPQSWEHLRAWLLCEVGHGRVTETWVGDTELAAVQRMVKALRDFHDEEDRFYWYYIQGESVIFRRPLTLKFAEVGEDEFKRITEAVFSKVYEVTGIDVDEYHQRWLAAHPERGKGKKAEGGK